MFISLGRSICVKICVDWVYLDCLLSRFVISKLVVLLVISYGLIILRIWDRFGVLDNMLMLKGKLLWEDFDWRVILRFFVFLNKLFLSNFFIDFLFLLFMVLRCFFLGIVFFGFWFFWICIWGDVVWEMIFGFGLCFCLFNVVCEYVLGWVVEIFILFIKILLLLMLLVIFLVSFFCVNGFLLFLGMIFLCCRVSFDNSIDCNFLYFLI